MIFFQTEYQNHWSCNVGPDGHKYSGQAVSRICSSYCSYSQLHVYRTERRLARNYLQMAKLQLHVKQICGRASRQTSQTKKTSFEKIVSPGSQVFKNHSCNSCQSSSKLSILPFDLLYFLCCIYLFFLCFERLFL